jgi:hypothetical protein
VALPDQARLLGHDDRPRARRLQLHAGALSQLPVERSSRERSGLPQHSPNILSAFERSQKPPDASTGAASFPALLQKGPLCGPFVMELAGLEPATPPGCDSEAQPRRTRFTSGFPASPAVRNPSDTPRLPRGFGDRRSFIPKTSGHSASRRDGVVSQEDAANSYFLIGLVARSHNHETGSTDRRWPRRPPPTSAAWVFHLTRARAYRLTAAPTEPRVA